MVSLGHSQSIKTDTLRAAKQKVMCDSLFDSGNYPEAAASMQKNIDIYQKYNLKDKYIYAEFFLIECSIRQGNFDEAVESLKKIKEKIDADNRLKKILSMHFYNAEGQVFLNKGRVDLALESFQKAMDNIFPGAKNQHEVFNNIGVAHWVAGNVEQALEFQNRALNICKTQFGEKSIKTAGIYNNIGLTYSGNDNAKSLENYTKALNIYIAVYGEGAVKPSIAIAYNNIGIIYKQKNELNQSLDYFEKALILWQKINGDTHPTVAFTLSNIGQVFTERNSYIKATDYLTQSLNIYTKVFGRKHPEVANTLNLLGNVYEKQGKYSQSLDYFQQALVANSSSFDEKNIYKNPSAKSYYNPNLMLTSLTLKARALEAIHYEKSLKRKQLVCAYEVMLICDTLLDNIRQSRTGKADKLALGAVATDVYESAIKLCLSLGESSLNKRKWHEKAFYFCEKSKSAVLLESISEVQAKSFAGIPDSLLEKEKQLKADLAFYEQKLAEAANESKMEKQYRDKLFILNRQYEAFSKKLEKNYPNYYNLKFNISIADISSIKKALPKDACLVSYFNPDKQQRLYVFYISKNGFKVYDIPKDTDYEKNIKGYRNSIIYQSGDVYAQTAYILRKQLFPKLPNQKHIIVVPEGRLGTIPFEALLKSKSKIENEQSYASLGYMVKSYVFSYEFSATLFLQAAKSGANKAENTALLCAPVDFTQHSVSAALNNLPGSEQEVNQISQLFNTTGINAGKLLGAEASESFIKSNDLKKYKYLHFATHGIVNESKPELSEIYLYKEKNSKEDGNLFSGEIYNLAINAELVTLSACQTGLGKITKGEGIIGLSRALLYAGAKNVVVSLWTVSDASTSKLMVDFYGNILKDKGGYGLSLQQAKKQLIEEKTFSKPYYWAPFVLIGK